MREVKQACVVCHPEFACIHLERARQFSANNEQTACWEFGGCGPNEEGLCLGPGRRRNRLLHLPQRLHDRRRAARQTRLPCLLPRRGRLRGCRNGRLAARHYAGHRHRGLGEARRGGKRGGVLVGRSACGRRCLSLRHLPVASEERLLLAVGLDRSVGQLACSTGQLRGLLAWQRRRPCSSDIGRRQRRGGLARGRHDATSGRVALQASSRLGRSLALFQQVPRCQALHPRVAEEKVLSSVRERWEMCDRA